MSQAMEDGDASASLSWRAIFDDVWQEIKTDSIIYTLIGVYFVSSWSFVEEFGPAHQFAPLLYLPLWLTGFAFVLALYFLLYEVPRAIRQRAASPFRHAAGAALKLPVARLIAGAVLFLAMAIFYGCFTSVKTLMPSLVPFQFDASLAGWDEFLHGGIAPWRLLQAILGRHVVTRVLEQLYLAPWFLLNYGSLALFAMHPRLAPMRHRFFIAYLLTWTLLGNIVAAWGMSAGPAFYGAVTGDHARFADLVKYLAFSMGSLNSAAALQDYLWSTYEAGRLQLGTGISAFPSIHVATATLLTLAAWSISRRAGLALGLFWVVVMAASVHLGWHYAVDGYVSTIGVIAIWAVVGRCLDRNVPVWMPAAGSLVVTTPAGSAATPSLP